MHDQEGKPSATAQSAGQISAKIVNVKEPSLHILAFMNIKMGKRKLWNAADTAL